MTRKLTLTALVALYLVVTLVGLVCLAAMGPLLAVVAFAGMAGNGFMAADWVGMIWNGLMDSTTTGFRPTCWPRRTTPAGNWRPTRRRICRRVGSRSRSAREEDERGDEGESRRPGADGTRPRGGSIRS
jgi:hypothetical protein